MESKAARDLAERLAGTVLSQDPGAPARMRARLAQLSGREWLRLDESMRRRYRSPLDVTGWPARLGADDGGIAAVAGSMDRDGLVREAAVAVLAQTPGRVAAAALAVRTADWVPQVGSAAVAAVRERTAAEDVVVIVPVLLAMADRRRGRLAAKAILAGLAAGPAGTLAGLSGTGERGGRMWALGALAGQDPVPVYRELLASPLPRQVAAALDGLDDLGDGSLPAAAVPFLAHPSPRVRYAAVHAVGRHSPPGDVPARRAPGTGSAPTWRRSAIRIPRSRGRGGRTCFPGCAAMPPPRTDGRRRSRPRRSPRTSPPARSPANSAGRWRSRPGSGRRPRCEGTRGVRELAV
jgi:hypothetical protein